METVVFIGAHPDDETALAGGTLAMLAANGHNTHVILATRGEGGELGDPPVTEDRSQIGAIREQEVRSACAALSVQSLQFLDYVDPFVGPDDELFPFEADETMLIQQLRDHITALQATVVLTHGADGEYGHPAHILMHRSVIAATQGLENPLLVYGVAARVPGIEDRLWNQNVLAQYALDITPWSQEKIAALECHVSQHALFKRRRELKTVAESMRSTESYYRYLPEADTTPDDAFTAILTAVGAYIPQEDADD